MRNTKLFALTVKKTLLGFGLITAFSGSAQACSIVPLNNVVALDQFVSTAPNTVEIDTDLALRFSGDCQGATKLSFAPRHWDSFDERPTIYIESGGQSLFNSIVGGLNSLHVNVVEEQQVLSIPLRIVADVSFAQHHSDVARHIEVSLERGGRDGVVHSQSSTLVIVEGENPEHFPNKVTFNTDKSPLPSASLSYKQAGNTVFVTPKI